MSSEAIRMQMFQHLYVCISTHTSHPDRVPEEACVDSPSSVETGCHRSWLSNFCNLVKFWLWVSLAPKQDTKMNFLYRTIYFVLEKHESGMKGKGYICQWLQGPLCDVLVTLGTLIGLLLWLVSGYGKPRQRLYKCTVLLNSELTPKLSVLPVIPWLRGKILQGKPKRLMDVPSFSHDLQPTYTRGHEERNRKEQKDRKRERMNSAFYAVTKALHVQYSSVGVDKDSYIEKPMVLKLLEGFTVLES